MNPAEQAYQEILKDLALRGNGDITPVELVDIIGAMTSVELAVVRNSLLRDQNQATVAMQTALTKPPLNTAQIMFFSTVICALQGVIAALEAVMKIETVPSQITPFSEQFFATLRDQAATEDTVQELRESVKGH
jgi:hypothetical protein